ncbi:hypothetical protein [Herbiconiux sp. A18JL235]|uniref:Uncharacterized protein n=1 Tax=Herbiconiux sp. A18JL235 TaxID=3152363 RepID=A0AB39BC81_9MICO
MNVDEPAGARFDVREFARTAVGTHRSEIDFDAFAETPLRPETVRLLAYSRELERSTMTYLRNVLVTPTHKDARVTAFLTTWAFEKYWIADAFEQVVAAHGRDPLAAQQLPRVRSFMLEVAERATPIIESFRANSIGTDVIALHLTSVGVDEWITESAYRRLAAFDPHPALVALLDRVQTVKARHREFVEADSLRRLAESKGARSLARRGLPRIQWPIGASSLPASETRFFYEHLFDAALAEEVDTRVRELPGLDSLHLVRDARSTALDPAGRAGALARRLGRRAAGVVHTLRRGAAKPTPNSTTTTTTEGRTHG